MNILEQHLNPMLGSSLIVNFLFTKIVPRGVFTCSRGSPEVITGSYPFEVCKQSEYNIPDSINHSLFLEMRSWQSPR